jgi:N-acetylmuramoyl-L-alanine amidase
VVETIGVLHKVLTPCGNEGYLAHGTPLYGVQVVLDPGHGGPADPGARAPTGLSEDDLNLRVVQATAEMLRERGVSVVLTRTGDYTSPLSVRAALADALGADLMLSIHHNAPTQGSASQPGIEVFYQSGSPESKRLGGLVWEYAMEALAAFDINWVAAADAGVMTVLNTRGIDAYGIIRHPDTVTALIELGYISNRPEAELFATPEYVTAASTALADAITAYLETGQAGDGYVAGRVFNPLPGVSRSVCVDPALRGQPTP